MTILNNKILIVAPHADDEVLGVGGTVAKLKHTHEIGLIVCGERERDDEKMIRAAVDHFDYVRLVPYYKDEQYHLNLRPIIKEIERTYSDFNADTVYIPNKDDFNNDHCTVHKACEVAFRRYQKSGPEKILMYEIPSSTTQSFKNNFHCNYYETLSKKHVDEKVEKLMMYKNEIREYPNPRSRVGLETYARFRGMECNSKFAEGFKLMYKRS